MRIAVVEPVGKGGMIHYAFQLSSAMARAGATVTLITERGYELDALAHNFELDKRLHLWDPKPDRAARSSLARRAGRAAAWYREWGRLALLLRKMRPDIVQFGDIRFTTDLYPLEAIRRTGLQMADICHNVTPFVASGEAGGTFHESPRGRRAYQKIYEQFATVFVHFDRNRQTFDQTFGLQDRSETIVHGNEQIFSALRDPSVTAGDVRRRLGIAGDAQVVLLFGTLSPYKRIDLLIEAFGRLRKDVSRAHLLLAGYPVGITPAEIRAKAAEAGISSSLSLVPEYIDSREIAAWMELASAVVFPYEAVFQSGAVHVPLTFGRPVIATDVGAMRDVINDGVTGLLVPPNDAASLADGVRSLLGDEDRAKAMGTRAAYDQQTRFSWDRPAETILSRYERDVAKRGRS